MKEQRNSVSIKMEAVTDSITKLDLQILDLESNNEEQKSDHLDIWQDYE